MEVQSASVFPDSRFSFLELDLVETPVDQEVEDFTRDIDCCEHGADDADEERYCKVVQWPRGIVEQDEARERSRDIRIKDCPECASISGLYGGPYASARPEFLAYAFINNNVRVDGHTDGEQDSRDTRQGKRGVHRDEDAQDINKV